MYKYRRVIVSVIALVLILSIISGVIVMAVSAKKMEKHATKICQKEQRNMLEC